MKYQVWAYKDIQWKLLKVTVEAVNLEEARKKARIFVPEIRIRLIPII